MAFVEIKNLSVHFNGVSVLHGLDLSIERGEALGLVGESGCGKSVTWLAVLGLLPRTATVSGDVTVDGVPLNRSNRRALEAVRGGRIAMIFQDPSSSLNPVRRIGSQIAEGLRHHRGLTGDAARAEGIRLLDMVGIPDARNRINLYPHEMSGGQCQRVMIAMALAGNPDLLIADEPTTALDATIQAQILDLLNQIRRETGMGLVFISHDLGAVSQVCEKIAVMYAGRVVESGEAGQIFNAPRHPYTRGLFEAIPAVDGGRERLIPIPGTVPDPRFLPAGCAFAPRCSNARPQCRTERPALAPWTDGRLLSCFAPAQDLPAAVARQQRMVSA